MAAVIGLGCFERELKPVNPCTTSVQTSDIQVTSVDTVDLLFMIDNSSSMQVHQQQLTDQLPRMINTLVTGTWPSGSTNMPFQPPRSIHMGVVSSTMGLGPITGIPSCPAGFGDDGVLFHGSPSPQPGCMADYSASYPHGIFEFTQGGAVTATAYTQAVACVAVLGTGGCGLEFELEPILKALAPSPAPDGTSSVPWTAPGYTPPMFYNGTFGHGNDPATNGGFLRANSALAIITVNDEDDGTVITDDDFAIFGTDSMYTGYQLNVRPVAFPSHLTPISRYVDGLIGLRRTPSLLIFSTITGIPNDLSPAPGMPTTPALLTQIIGDPRMIPMIDPAMTQKLLPVCQAPGGGQTAVPGIRMVQVAQGLQQRGASVAVHSVCDASFLGAIDDIVDKISSALHGACLGRALNPDASGNVNCDVLEVLPSDPDPTLSTCAGLAHPEAYTHLRDEVTMDAAGHTTTRQVCRVRQVGRAGAVATTPGWAYDDGTLGMGISNLPTGCGQRIGFFGITPITNAEVQLQCAETILPGTGNAAELGAFCTPATMPTATVTGNVNGTTMDCNTGVAVAGNPQHLACDLFTRSCQIPCTTDSECTTAGLLSYICDNRTATDFYAPNAIPMSTPAIMPGAIHHFCVNPTCGVSAAMGH
jgi:hypothetical protein